MDGIHFTQPDGNFKAKKYLQVNFNNPTHLFHFKNTFEKSYLNGCWFLTTKIPRLRSKQLEEDKHNRPLSNVQVPLTNNFKRKFYQTNTTRVHNHFNQNPDKGNFQNNNSTHSRLYKMNNNNLPATNYPVHKQESPFDNNTSTIIHPQINKTYAMAANSSSFKDENTANNGSQLLPFLEKLLQLAKGT